MVREVFNALIGKEAYSRTFFFSLGQSDSAKASAVVVNKSHAVFIFLRALNDLSRENREYVDRL